MDLMQLQYFLAIAQTGSMTHAARQLFVSQPNLSVSMSKLEEELGAELFIRRKGKIVFTEPGKVFLEYVQRVFKELDSGVERVRSYSMDTSNQLSVASGLTDLVGSALFRMGEDASDIRISQITCANDEICDIVKTGRADIGILFGDYTRDDLEYFPLGERTRVALVREAHPLAAHKRISLLELKDYPFTFNRGRDDKEIFQHIGHRYGIHPRVYCECDDPALEYAILDKNDYVSISTLVNYLKLRRQYPEIAMRPLMITEPLPVCRIGLVRRTGHKLTDTALRFEAAIIRFFEDIEGVSEKFAQTYFGEN